VGPKHVEIRQYINKIEIVTSVVFYSIYWTLVLFGLPNVLKPALVLLSFSLLMMGS